MRRSSFAGRSTAKTQHPGPLHRTLLLAGLFLCLLLPTLAAAQPTQNSGADQAQAPGEPTAPIALRWIAEQTAPLGIEMQPRAERRALAKEATGQAALDQLRQVVRSMWPQIQAQDLWSLSRFHREQTRGYSLPAQPGSLPGRILGRGEDGSWFLELLGPRLPARFDIVHRHLAIYAAYDAQRGAFTSLFASIRLEVQE